MFQSYNFQKKTYLQFVLFRTKAFLSNKIEETGFPAFLLYSMTTQAAARLIISTILKTVISITLEATDRIKAAGPIAKYKK